MDLKLTAGQEEALQAIRLIRKSEFGGDVAVINGYAGTGKTTLLKVLAEEFGEHLLVVTPTGKASQRVKEVAPVNAMTIHRWLYWPSEDDKGNVRFSVRDDIQTPPGNLLIIDEASMVSQDIWKDILRACQEKHLNIVAIGDGFQLPPVVKDKKDPFSILAPEFPANIKVHMTEVVRQALDNPIIRISMAVRENTDFTNALMELPAVSEKKLTEKGLQTWSAGGAVICHRNETRHMVNTQVRRARGLKDISINEPLLVLRNNYDLDRFNGEVVTLQEITETVAESFRVRDWNKGIEMGMKFIAIKLEDNLKAIISEEQVLGLADEYSDKFIHRACRKAAWAHWPGDQDDYYPPYLHANFGYCLTAHKSQGSEFPLVLVAMEPSIKLFTTQGRRWLYTAISRTRGECTLCWLS